MAPTLTKVRNTSDVALPKGLLSFMFPTSETDNSRGHINATIPKGSRANAAYHWHETHTEFHKILKGRALVTLDGVTREYTSNDEELTIKPFVKHIIQLADEFRAEGEPGDDEDWRCGGVLSQRIGRKRCSSGI
ncbi:hypothetical protein FRB94_013979 [Tulasnella sp. JGI-2019a]|nr:hypothetical protein FRB93_001997 [Tulasnella sp. JGI-2019a]KAG9007744.1 hypothetical protein FRB94_013979 [Tulasnella sp. JGI-2019a]